MTPQTFADAEGAVFQWVNTLTTTLVGPGNPLPKGATLDQLRGAAPDCYAWISQVGGGTWFGAENPDQRARISAQVYGPTKQSALLAAAAYAEALVGLNGRPVAVTGARILLVDSDTISGPLWLPDTDLPRYVVDADFFLRPA